MVDELQLLSGNDIPFPEAQIVIHPPTIKEIGLIGEETFFSACESLVMISDTIIEGKTGLINVTGFEILMSIMLDKNPEAQARKNQIIQLLNLIFPNFDINIDNQKIELQLIKDNDISIINSSNFRILQEILKDIFCMEQIFSKNSNATDFNPAGERARAIAEKIKKGRQKAAALKGPNATKISILNRYASILAIGQMIPLSTVLNYTMYQLYDNFGRYELKQASDFYISAKLAGATGMKETEDWMKDIHSVETDNLI